MQSDTPLPTVLQAVRCEVASLGDQAQQLQDQLSPTTRSEQSETLQMLDVLTQHLFGLVVFFDTLIPALPAHAVDLSPALDALTLSDLARRLGGLPVEPVTDPGGLELFDD